MVAAAAVAKILDIRNEIIEGVAETLRVWNIGWRKWHSERVTYFDDSFSTVPETTIAAIKAFSEPMILIAEVVKGSDLPSLKSNFEAKNIKAVILIGLMADRIDKPFLIVIRIVNLSNMSEIVSTASSIAEVEM